jgi:hypothetical protein
MGLLLLAATLGGGAVQDASAQAIQAKVVDATNNRPIRDAEVQLLGPNGGVVKAMLSDRDGRVYLTAPRPGVYMVAVQRLGYPAADTLRVNLEQGRTITTQIALQPEAIEVEGVTVTAEPINWNLELVGFYNRQRGSTGYFKEIGITDERRAVTTSDYFRQARAGHPVPGPRLLGCAGCRGTGHRRRRRSLQAGTRRRRAGFVPVLGPAHRGRAHLRFDGGDEPGGVPQGRGGGGGSRESRHRSAPVAGGPR